MREYYEPLPPTYITDTARFNITNYFFGAVYVPFPAGFFPAAGKVPTVQITNNYSTLWNWIPFAQDITRDGFTLILRSPTNSSVSGTIGVAVGWTAAV